MISRGRKGGGNHNPPLASLVSVPPSHLSQQMPVSGLLVTPHQVAARASPAESHILDQEMQALRAGTV
jgi:hypothetical protein